MVIRVFFSLLLLGTVSVVAVALAVHFRVKRHLRQQDVDAQIRPVIEAAVEEAVEENRSQPSS